MQLDNDSSSEYASMKKPWLKYYQDEYIDIPLPGCSMYEMVYSCCKAMKKENDTALYYYGTEISFSEMFSLIDTYAAAFTDCGVKRGDYVSFLTVALPESIVSIYALNRIGAVCNFIDVRTDAAHVREFIKKAKSDVLIVCDKFYHKVENSLDELGLRLIICENPSQNLPFIKRMLYGLKNKKPGIPYDNERIMSNRQFAARGSEKPIPKVLSYPDDPAIVTRTGGTTGASKGVVLTNQNLNAIALNFKASCMDKVPEKRSLLNFLPIGSSYGIAVGVHMAMCMGCEDILIPNFNPDEFDKLIMKFRPNHIIAVPMFYQKLIDSKLLKNKDLSFIHTMASGGDFVNSALERRLESFRLEHNIEFPVAQGYGLSEGASAVAFGFQNIHKDGSAGIPSLSCVIAAFRPESEEELAIGKIGELCVRGASVMKEYLDEPEETENIIKVHNDGNRWIHTGDLGYIDEDGFVFIVGRIKRVIARFDGHKVYPLQLEHVVLKHPAVKNCVAIAVKDRRYEQGDLPLIVVETLDKKIDNGILRKEILKLCEEEIELRSQPADVAFVSEIPLTKLSKNDYRALEKLFYNYEYG